ncbi:hypothetical protein VTJ49DRAFT_3114 [Mycothermus thermophilus]|uniref:Uncharacterized protein n=1 Tax=Humicola insolens TaxID=85995 RepID=A0ABR3V8H7_HUMIN
MLIRPAGGVKAGREASTSSTTRPPLSPSQPTRGAHVYKHAFEELMPGVRVPENVGVSCCSQLAVSHEAIRSWPKDDYVRWRKWLLKTPMSDDLSGRVFKYMWHIIFGKEVLLYPSAPQCYCDLYGLCNLKCGMRRCEGRVAGPL